MPNKDARNDTFTRQEKLDSILDEFAKNGLHFKKHQDTQENVYTYGDVRFWIRRTTNTVTKRIPLQRAEYYITIENDDSDNHANARITFGKLPANIEGLTYEDVYEKRKIADRMFADIQDIIAVIRENVNMKTMKQSLEDLLEKGKKKQIIFTGAPGTGKTYTAKTYVEEYAKKHDTSGNVFIQFHSAFDYTDFVEGLRPVIMQGTQEPTFVRLDGIFKEFCRKVVAKNTPERNYFFVIDEINRADLSRVFGELMFCLEESYRGKDHKVKTQYHNLPTYEIVDGEARIMEHDCFQEGFYIPENVIIIGTMNDIDRSVEAFDFALRRRFQWIEVDAKAELDALNNQVKHFEHIEEIKDKIHNMNRYFNPNDTQSTYQDMATRFHLDKSYQIGHAYFKDYDPDTNPLKDIFQYRIEPILKEYVRGRKDAHIFIEACRNALSDPAQGM